MKLSKALKTKNRLAGEVALAQRLINEHNITEGENQPQHDVVKLYAGLIETQRKLADIKGKIAVANAPIAKNIFALSETKARIAFLRAIPVKEGKLLASGGYRADSVFIDYKSAISSATIENNIRNLQEEVDRLQDEIDEFNAKTEIS